MNFERQKDPTQLPVQLNTRVTWQLREDLTVIAKNSGTTVSVLVLKAIEKVYASEIADAHRKRTAEAGATR